jgi:DNA repair protein RadC
MAELIAILIGSGSRDESALDLAKRILSSVDHDLSALAIMSPEELCSFKGIGQAKAISIAAALELGRRRRGGPVKQKAVISSSQMAFELIAPQLIDLPHEEFWIMLLNRANRMIEIKNVSKGGVSGTVADAKLIFKAALSKLASSIILFHNHPSGNLKPSRADLQLTDKLVKGGKNLDIAVLDHLIIGNNSYFSFADEGLI